MYVSPSKKVEDFFNKYKPLFYKKGETIIRASDKPRGVNCVIRGYVRLYSLNQEGMEFTLNIFKPGSYFPVMWAIGGEDNRYYYEALTPVEIRRAPKNDLLFFIKNNPGVLYELTKRIISGLRGLVIRMEQLLLGDAREKVGTTLFLLAKRFGENSGGQKIIIMLPMTHQGIAGLSGLSRETTSLEMKKFEREGIISKEKRFIVVNKMRKLKPNSFGYTKGGQLAHSL
jgi:CRP/FNR family transcriptional regulator